MDIEAFREAIIGNGVITGFLVAQSAVPAMTVLVPAGSCTVDGVVYSEPSGQNLNISNGDATYDRKDIVVYDTSAGNPVVVAGTPAAAPIPADIPSGDILLGIVLVEANETTSILDADITNDRVYANIRWAHTAVSVNTTLTDAHYVVTVNATGGARTITLPTASGILGKIYAIKKIDSSGNPVTINGDGAETIDGLTTLSITAQWSAAMIQSDGTNWVRLSTNMTDNNVRDAVEAATDSNTFTDADHTKLNGVEAGATDTTPAVIVKVVPDDYALTIGNGKTHFTIPIELNGKNLITVGAHVYTTSSSGTPTFMIHNLTDTNDMLSTAITIDATEVDSITAATPAVINTSYDDVATGDVLRFDCDVAGTGTKGMEIRMGFE